MRLSKMGEYQARQKNQKETITWDSVPDFADLGVTERKPLPTANGHRLKFDANGKWVK